MAIRDNYKIYVNKFTSQEEVQAALDNQELYNPYVALIETESGSSIDYNTDEPTDFSKEYFTMEMLESGNTKLKMNEGLYYSYNGGEWTSLSADKTLSVQVGDKIRFKGDLRRRNSTFTNQIGHYGLKNKVYGNLMSLFYEDNFEGAPVPFFGTAGGACTGMFYKSKVVDASNLIFPSMTVNTCYGTMWWDSKELVYPPKVLPALVVAEYAYKSMFDGCSKLIQSPDIQAQQATENGAINNMFQNCSSLTKIKCNILYLSGYKVSENWVSGVAATGTFVKNANMSSWPTGADGIPTGWTVQDA